jgi:hypothetical protein
MQQMRSELDRTAIHEAGHAVIGYHFRSEVRDRGVTIDLEKPGNGNAHIRSSALIEASVLRDFGGVAWQNWIARAEREMMICLAGPLAELRYVHGRSPSGVIGPDSASADLTQARALFGCICADDPTRFVWWLYHDQVRGMLRERRTWRAIAKMAELLHDTGFVSEDAVQKVCAEQRVPQISLREWIGQSRSTRSLLI